MPTTNQRTGSRFLAGVGNLLKGKDRDSGAAAGQDTRNSMVNDIDYQEEISRLPAEFDKAKMFKRRKQVDNCMLCEQPFTKALTLLNRNPVRHCKKCAKSICEVCSENKR